MGTPTAAGLLVDQNINKPNKLAVERKTPITFSIPKGLILKPPEHGQALQTNRVARFLVDVEGASYKILNSTLHTR